MARLHPPHHHGGHIWRSPSLPLADLLNTQGADVERL